MMSPFEFEEDMHAFFFEGETPQPRDRSVGSSERRAIGPGKPRMARSIADLPKGKPPPVTAGPPPPSAIEELRQLRERLRGAAPTD